MGKFELIIQFTGKTRQEHRERLLELADKWTQNQLW